MRLWIVFLTVVGLLWSSVGLTNVVISGTRIIYPAQNKEIGIELTNADGTPALLQAWISNANDDRTAPTPFVLTPPIFRMDGNKKQTLRVMYTHEPLASDRETLFYFNLLDIPPVPKQDDDAPQNYLQFSLLSKLKFFYRPKNLSPTIDKAYSHLQVHSNHQGITIHNPTPYFMTVSEVALFAQKDDEQVISKTTETPMIEPFGKADIKIESNNAKFAKLELVNDYGGQVSIPLAIQ